MMNRLWRTQLETAWDADRFDLAEWMAAQEAVPMLTGADSQASRDLCGHPVQDGFLGLFKSNPRLADTPSANLEPLADLLRRATETPEWNRLRETTVGDVISAGIGSVALVEETFKALPDVARQQAQKQAKEQAKADEAEAQAESLMSLAEMLQERARGEGQAAANAQLQAEDIQRRAMQAQTQAAQCQARATGARAAFQATVNERSAQIAAAINNAVKAANEQAQEAGEFMRSFSLAAGGDPSGVDPQTARAAMETLKNNPNLKRLAELLGWARKMVRGEWRKSPRARTELMGYETRPLQPEHMAGFEWAALLSGDETLHTDWLRRALDGGIRHRKFGGKEQQGRGPFVLVRDESGSMEGAPHALAVALEWALLEITRRDKREFYCIPFSGTGQFHVWQAPKPGEPDPQGLLAHLSHFYGGGTEPYSPIVKALEVIEGHQLRADVLVITDAAFGDPPDEFTRKLAEVKQRQPLRVVSVIVGAESPSLGGGAQAQAFSDRVISVDDLIADREQLRGAIADVV